MSEEDRVLGNLPRSRPGRRSPRRDAAAGSRTSRQRSAAPQGPGGAGTPPEEDGPPLATDADIEVVAGGDPLSGAVRVAANVARTGVRAAGRLTGGLFSRLPRR